MVKIITKPLKKRRKDSITINLTLFIVVLKGNNNMTVKSTSLV
jgi:hypothetical protein